MSGVKGKQDDGDWGIPVQRYKNGHTKAHELTHNTNSENCWCCPDLCQVCRTCGVQIWEDGHIDESAETPDALPLMEKVKAQADPGCPTCKGRGLEPKYDDELAQLIFHH